VCEGKDFDRFRLERLSQATEDLTGVYEALWTANAVVSRSAGERTPSVCRSAGIPARSSRPIACLSAKRSSQLLIGPPSRRLSPKPSSFGACGGLRIGQYLYCHG
jgi:hypothetical protein